MNRNNIIIYSILLLICLLAFGNSLHNDFLMDDFPMLIQNPSIGDASFLQWSPYETGIKQRSYFRPITHWLNFIMFTFFGEIPSWYHITHIFLFFLAATAIYKIITLLFHDKLLAFLTAILFCTHPINSALINYKNGTGLTFLLLALTLSLKDTLLATTSHKKIFPVLFSVIWYGIALLSHEMAIFYPITLLIILLFTKKQNIKLSIPIFSAAFAYTLFRMGYASLKTSVLDNIELFKLSFIEYIASFIKLVFWYITKLFTLNGIVLAWDTIPTKHWIWIAGLILLLSLIIITIKNSNRSPLSLGIFWLSAGFIPVTLACFSRPLLGFIIQPHWLSFASIGFFLFVSALFRDLSSKTHPRVTFLSFLCIFFFYLINSWHYNYLWGNEKRYCQHWLKISPNNYWPNFWLGHAYLEEKDYRNAKKPLLKILHQGINDYTVYGNLGLAEFHLGNLNKAEQYFQTSLKRAPRHADTYYYLGEIYLKRGEIKKAKFFFSKAIKFNKLLQVAQDKLESL